MDFLPKIRVAIILLACLTCANFSQAAQVVRIGVLAKRGPEHTLHRWQPTADYLSQQIEGYRFTIAPLDFEKIDATVANKAVDFILVNSAIYVELEMHYGVGRIATIINRLGDIGSSEFGGVIVTRANRSDIQHLADIADKRFAAVDKTSLGGYLMAWREMAQAGLSPPQDTTLSFLGTHDEVIYALLDNLADVGTVRTDTLERMEEEGKIASSQFKIINPQHHADFNYLCSTRLYPEWPLAKLSHTSEALSNAVVSALLRMPDDHPAANAAELTGWRVPRNYQPVHELLRELRVGPYAQLGTITLKDLLVQYWQWILFLCVSLLSLSVAVIYVSRLNLRLRDTENALIDARDSLADKVEERTRELGESHRRLERISKDWNDAFDAIADPIFIHDRNMLIVQANPAYCQRAQHKLEEMIGRPYYEFFPKLDAPMPRCLEEKEHLLPEGNELRLANGEIFVSRSFTIFRTDQSNRHSIHIMEDVTAIRSAEARQRTLSRALEQAGEGVMIFNDQHQLLYCNPALRQLLKIDADQGCLGRDILQGGVVSKPFTRQLLHLFSLAERGEPASGEMELVSGTDQKQPVFITVSCLSTEEGASDGYVMTVLDLSELKQAEKALTYRIGLESMIAGIASRLVNVNADRIDREVEEALQQLGEFAATDRAYLFHYNASDDTISTSHEWCHETATPIGDALQQLSFAQLPWLHDTLFSHQKLAVADIAELPENAQEERTIFTRIGTKSLLIVPLQYGGQFSGFITFDTLRKQRHWTEADIHLLRLAGEIIIHGLERVRSLVRLQRSEASLAAAQYIAQVGSWEWDLHTNELIWSDETYRIFGFQPQKTPPSYDTFLQTVHPEDRDHVASSVNKALAGEENYAIDHRLLRADGSVTIVHEIGQVDRDETNTAVRMIGTVQDVTKLRQSELETQRLNRALRTLSKCNMTLVHASNEQALMNNICRTLIDSGGYRFAWVGYAHDNADKSIHPVAFHGHENGFIDTLNLTWGDDERGLNPAGFAIRTREPFIARRIDAMVDSYAPWQAAALKQGYQSVVALPLISENKLFGVIVIDSLEADAFDDSELLLLMEMAGDLAFGILTLRIREERKQAEQALRETEARYEELYENAPNGYVSIAAQDGRLLQYNQAVCDLLGYDRDDLSGKTIYDLCASGADGIVRATELFSHFSPGENTRNAELELCHSTGDSIWVDISVDPVDAVRTSVREYRSCLTDITARKQAETEQRHFAEQMQTSLLQTIRAIALTIEKRDPYTAGHQERVAELAVRIGEELGLDDNRLRGLHLGAMIHDIGKISVPAEILNRPGRLEPALFTILKAHPQIGFDIIKEIDFPWPLADMVLHHHEHLDGSGYPDGLKGDEISLESRILAVADVVEAMASHRPYRPALGIEIALKEVEDGKGSFYDPAVVDSCQKIFREQGSPWRNSDQNLST
jgi:PAS domain S-box-containing protein